MEKNKTPEETDFSTQMNRMEGEEEIRDDQNKENLTDADVTEEDMIALGDKDRDPDMGEDEDIESVKGEMNLRSEELDVPGSELDDENEELGEEDEENNYYSLGGDNHDEQEGRLD